MIATVNEKLYSLMILKPENDQAETCQIDIDSALVLPTRQVFKVEGQQDGQFLQPCSQIWGA